METAIDKIMLELNEANVAEVFELISKYRTEKVIKIEDEYHLKMLKNEFLTGRYGGDFFPKLRLFIMENIILAENDGNKEKLSRYVSKITKKNKILAISFLCILPILYFGLFEKIFYDFELNQSNDDELLSVVFYSNKYNFEDNFRVSKSDTLKNILEALKFHFEISPSKLAFFKDYESAEVYLVVNRRKVRNSSLTVEEYGLKNNDLLEVGIEYISESDISYNTKIDTVIVHFYGLEFEQPSFVLEKEVKARLITINEQKVTVAFPKYYSDGVVRFYDQNFEGEFTINFDGREMDFDLSKVNFQTDYSDDPDVFAENFEFF